MKIIDLFIYYLCFKPFSYRTLPHRAFVISSSWFLFHDEVVKIKHYVEKNSFPLSFGDKEVKFFFENKINEKSDAVNTRNNVVKYNKLPYIGHMSTCVKHKITRVKHKITRLCKFFCKISSIEIALTPFKVAHMFNVKYPIPNPMKLIVTYKLVCPGCNACYIFETNSPFVNKD